MEAVFSWTKLSQKSASKDVTEPSQFLPQTPTAAHSGYRRIKTPTAEFAEAPLAVAGITKGDDNGLYVSVEIGMTVDDSSLGQSRTGLFASAVPLFTPKGLHTKSLQTKP